MPSVILSTLEDQKVGQPLTLKCDVTIVRGITNELVVVWSSDGLELKRTEGINVSSVTQNSVLYVDLFTISLLSTADEDRTYKCTVVVTTPTPVLATDSVILNVTGKHIINNCAIS